MIIFRRCVVLFLLLYIFLMVLKIKNQPRLSLGQSLKVQCTLVVETCRLSCAMVILPPAGTLSQTTFLVHVKFFNMCKCAQCKCVPQNCIFSS